MTREEFIRKWLGNKDKPYTEQFRDEMRDDLDEIIKSSLPPAEGAEEIAQRCPVCGGNGLVPNGFYTQTSGHWSSISTVPETCRSCNGTGVVFAALHAQRIADKMVSERLREELIGYDKFLSNTYWGISHIIKRDEAVDEYLKSREK